jgi:translation initiation factor 1
MSKKRADKNGFVYSTDPNFRFEEGQSLSITLPPQEQKLRIKLETKHRGGKMATVVTGFAGTNEDGEQLARQLKNHCGTGGSFKDGEILVQGDQRDKVWQWLLQNRYSLSKKI